MFVVKCSNGGALYRVLLVSQTLSFDIVKTAAQCFGSWVCPHSQKGGGGTYPVLSLGQVNLSHRTTLKFVVSDSNTANLHSGDALLRSQPRHQLS